MKKKLLASVLSVTMLAALMTGCGNKAEDTTSTPETKVEESKEEVKVEETKAEVKEEVKVEETKVEEAPAGPVVAEPEALPETPFAHLTFDGADEGYTLVTQVEKAADSANDGATFDIAPAEGAFQYATGPVGNCIFLDGKAGLDLGLEATNTDAYTVSYWMNADRLATYGATLQMGYNMGKAADVGNNVTWFNVTQSEWGANSAKIFPIVWSRNEASDAADGTDCWPWMYGWDDSIHGKREWVHVTIVCSGEEQASPLGSTTAGAQYYINGAKVYDSQDNYTNGTYFEYTWDATLAPNIMEPGDAEFESLFGINYWDTIFKGYVDDLYVYDTALTAGQVATLYQMGDATVEPVLADGTVVEVEEPVAVNVEPTGTAVGATDCTTAFWGAHSDIWAVAEGETVSKTFVNWHGAEASNWNNFVVILQNVAEGHSAADNADYKEYGVVRADNWGWNSAMDTANPEIGWTLESNWNWDTFSADLQGATVTVNVTNNGATADVVCDVVTAAGANYQQSYKNIAIDGDLYYCLTVDNCCLDIQ
ncbi:MAG: LamG domain-containing protein [Lachnospiraceae bacterium]|nr:LamG domain-containing protein [Lachnospiraceae bacterium]